MSAPENTSPLDQASTPTEHHLPAAEPPLDVTQALWQLRALTCGLGLCLLVVSLIFTAFVWKQNRNLAAETNLRNLQITQIENNHQRLQPVIKELARSSIGNAELALVFKRFGIEITTPPLSNSPPSTIRTP